MNQALLTLIGTGFGAAIGSFIATLVLRWPAGKSVVEGRSRCDSCGTTVAPWHLIPLLSYICLRGKGRCCGQSINPLHPAVEMTAAAVGAIAFTLFGWNGMVAAMMGWLLLTLALLDARHFWLPDGLTAALAAAGLASVLFVPIPSIGDRILGLITGYAALAAIAALYRHIRGHAGMGGGDPKLLGAIGAWIGWQALPFVLLGASVIGLLCALIMHIAGRSISRATRLPLGTFLAAAAWAIGLYVQWVAEAGYGLLGI